MTWGPLPPYKGNISKRRDTFIDIEVVGLFATRGNIGDLDITNTITLATGGLIRTSASGQRIEIQESATDAINFYSGNAIETDHGRIRSDATGTGDTEILFLAIESPTQTGDNSTRETTQISLITETNDNGATAPAQIHLGFRNAQGVPEVKVINGAKLMIEDGTAALPSLTFNNDVNTGLWRPAADQVGIVGGGATLWTAFSPAANESGWAADRNASYRIVYNDSAHQWKLYVNNVLELVLGATGFTVPNVYNATTGTTTPVTVLSTGQMLRDTSALKYKSRVSDKGKYIDDLADINLTPYQFYRRDDKRWFVGFIADYLAEQHPLLGTYNDDGGVESYDHKMVDTILAAKLNRLEAQVLELQNG